MKKEIALIEVWLGKLPDYFKYHLETIKMINCVDFYFFTDDRTFDFSKYSYPHLHVNYLDQEEFLLRFNRSSKIKIDKIKFAKKIVDFKLSYFRMFPEIVEGYGYVGIYDIDTLFGDISSTLVQSLGNYDFISVGDEKYHNRLSGPLLIMKNDQEILNQLDTDRYYETLIKDEIYGYGEQELSKVAFEKYRTKIIYSINTETHNGGKNTYESYWTSGKLYVNKEEKLLYHFYRKNETKIIKNGNIISTFYNKELLDDFCWVVHFSENYEKLIPALIRSIKKYSNRKCIFYTINYFPSLAFQTQYFSDQFIFKEIKIPNGKLDGQGRDFNIMTSKPKILLDAIKSFPEKKFVHLDTDIYLTTNSDNICQFFETLEDYPLANSHVHDVIFISNIVPTEEWTSSLHVLLKAEDIEQDPIYPRRKCNVIVFDERSEWFFTEQMNLYEKYGDSNIPGILAIYDEDTFNALLAKYRLTKSLPLVDIEESYNLNIDKIHNYSYNIITKNISPNLIPPSTLNDFLFFHGFKNVEDYFKIENEYGNTVLDCEEMVVTYKDNTLFFEKNSFLTTKNNNGLVDFVVSDINRNVLFKLENQDLNAYWLFYISNLYLHQGSYFIEIYRKENNHKIFNSILKVN